MASTISFPSSTTARVASAADRSTTGRRLRAVLGLNATTSAVAGAVALLAPGWTTRMLGAGTTTVARIVGVVLIVFALDVGLVVSGRLPRPSLRSAAGLISTVDVAWVLASIGVVATGQLSGRGVAITILQAVGVVDFAVAQLLLARRLTR